MLNANPVILFIYFTCMMALHLEGCLRKDA